MEITGYKDKHEWTNKNGVTSVVYLMDCMDLLKQIPDKYFELAVVDPPYGIDAANMTMGAGSRNDTGKNKAKDWDKNKPNKDYFDMLAIKSTEQVIWGGNYYDLPPTQCFLIWDKLDYNSDFAAAELAWTSFKKVTKIFQHARNKGKNNKIHPTQKPVLLYEWIFKNYAKPNDKILDTHLGSASSRIAADKANLPFVGCELDADHFYDSVKRFNNYSAQLTIF